MSKKMIKLNVASNVSVYGIEVPLPIIIEALGKEGYVIAKLNKNLQGKTIKCKMIRNLDKQGGK